MRYMEGYTYMISPFVIAVMHFVHAAHEKNVWKSVLVSDCSSDLYWIFLLEFMCLPNAWEWLQGTCSARMSDITLLPCPMIPAFLFSFPFILFHHFFCFSFFFCLNSFHFRLLLFFLHNTQRIKKITTSLIISKFYLFVTHKLELVFRAKVDPVLYSLKACLISHIIAQDLIGTSTTNKIV